MKKIVALALCLIMALSLATVAFGATAIGSTTDAATATDGLAYSLYTYKNAHDKTVAIYKIKVVDTRTSGVTTESYVKEGDTELQFVITNDDNSDYVLVDGNKVTYLRKVTTDADATYAKTATVVKTVKAAKTDKVCGDVYHNYDKVVYEDADGTYYTAYTAGDSGTPVILNVDGALVAANVTSNVQTVSHVYAADTKIVAGETTVTKLYCKNCKAEFTFETSSAKAIAAFGVNGFTKVEANAIDGYDEDLFVKKTATAAAGTTTGVTSAKTFDAGVALYAGMALMSVAGSAVVIGKKKEF